MKIEMTNNDNNNIDTNDDRLYCDFTYCIYNSSCCGTPTEEALRECHCTKSNNPKVVMFNQEEEYCRSFVWNDKLPGKCVSCQMDEYGEVSMQLLNTINDMDLFDDDDCITW